MADSRGGKRFPLALPITIHDGKSSRGLASRTMNLSAAGAYISGSPELEVGSKVEFAITVPGSMVGSRKDVEIKCRGRVVRRDAPRKGRKASGKAGKKSGRGKSGLALVIEHYKFMRK
ncbi:MAG: PilZ domain-containing protein [Terriglobales bacterium]